MFRLATIFLAVALVGCGANYNDTSNLTDKVTAAHISLLQATLSSTRADLKNVKTYHFDGGFTCGEADEKYFLVKDDKVFISDDVQTNYAISTCCIDLSAYHRFKDKPGIGDEFTKEKADSACAQFTPAVSRYNLSGLINKVDSVADIDASDSARETAATILNLNGHLCARVTGFRERNSSGDVLYEIDCVEYRNGTGRQTYLIDPRTGKAWPR